MQQRQPNVYKADHREKKVICQIINAIFLLTKVERFRVQLSGLTNCRQVISKG
jgi:hypothetical protein